MNTFYGISKQSEQINHMQKNLNSKCIINNLKMEEKHNSKTIFQSKSVKK